MSVHQVRRHMAAHGIGDLEVERHPRLVFEAFGDEEEAIVRYYLEKGRAFTVVLPAP